MATYSDPTELASLQRGKQKKSATGRKKSRKDEQQDVAKFVADMRHNIDAAWRDTQTWREQALESYKFAEGNHYADREREDNPPTSPQLTVNDILPIIRSLSGIERQGKEDFKIIPRAGGDVDSAKVMGELFRFVTDQNLWFYQRIRKSNDVNITGKGFIKVDISYDSNVNGDILMKRRNPLAVFEDPMSEEWDGSDRKWCGEGIWTTEEEAKELWPEFEDQINIGDWLSSEGGGMDPALLGDRHADNSLFVDRATRRVRIFDYWYKQRQPVTLYVCLSTGEVEPATEHWLSLYEQMPPDQQADHRFIRKVATVVRVATFCNWILLQDKESPLPHPDLPITRYVGLQFYHDPFGAVHPLKDMARLQNKAMSQAMNHLNRSVNSGWLNHATEGADVNILEKYGSVPGVVLNYKSMKPDRIEPSPISAGHFTLAEIAANKIKSISLVNAELQGLNDAKVQSGVAIERRQQGGLVGNEDLFDNGLLGDKVVGPQVIKCIQLCFTPERVHRTVENLSSRDAGGIAALMLQNNKNELPEWIENALKNEYDYVVDRSAALQSARQQQSRDLTELAATFAKASGGWVPPTLVHAVLRLQDSLTENDLAQIKTEMQMQAAGMPPGMAAGMPGNGAGPVV